MEKKYKKYIPFAVTGLVSAAVFFYCGMVYGQQSSSGARQQFQQARGQRTGAFQAGGGFISGQVLSKDAQTITVKTRDGSSHIIVYSGSTSVDKPVAGSISDVLPGTNVMVGGTQNSDGSITAQTIQIRGTQPQ